jgi:uncharacterized protein YkwD
MPRLALIGALLSLILGLAACGTDLEQPTETITIEAPEGEGPPGDEDVDTQAAEERCPGASEDPEPDTREQAAAVTLCLVNHERAQEGLDELRDDPNLTQAAQDKAQDMVEQDYFAHVGPDGREVGDWVEPTGYLTPGSGFTLAENLATASEGASSPAHIVHGWMNSPSHRRNILRGALRDSGIGIAMGVPEHEEPGATYAHMFGAVD